MELKFKNIDKIWSSKKGINGTIYLKFEDSSNVNDISIKMNFNYIPKRNLFIIGNPISQLIGLKVVSMLIFHDVLKIIRAITNPAPNDNMIEVHTGFRSLLIVTSYIFVVSITPNNIKIRMPPTQISICDTAIKSALKQIYKTANPKSVNNKENAAYIILLVKATIAADITINDAMT